MQTICVYDGTYVKDAKPTEVTCASHRSLYHEKADGDDGKPSETLLRGLCSKYTMAPLNEDSLIRARNQFRNEHPDSPIEDISQIGQIQKSTDAATKTLWMNYTLSFGYGGTSRWFLVQGQTTEKILPWCEAYGFRLLPGYGPQKNQILITLNRNDNHVANTLTPT